MKSNLPKTQPARDEGPGPTPRSKIRTSEKVPSHPKVDASTMGVLGDGVEREHEDCESKGDEVGKANGDNGKYCSTGSRDKPTLQLKSPENNPSVLADLPVSRNKSPSGESTAAENKQGRQSTNIKSSTATDFKLSVASSNQPPTSKRVSESKSPPDSSADDRWAANLFRIHTSSRLQISNLNKGDSFRSRTRLDFDSLISDIDTVSIPELLGIDSCR